MLVLGNPQRLAPRRRKALDQEHGAKPTPADLVVQIRRGLVNAHRLQTCR